MTKYLNEWNSWVSNKPLIKEFDMGSYKEPTKKNLSLRDGTYLAKTIFFAIQKQINDSRYLNVAGRPINKDLLVSYLTETEAFDYLNNLPTTSLDKACEEIENKFNLYGMLEIIPKYYNLWDSVQAFRNDSSTFLSVSEQIKAFDSFIGEVMPLGLLKTFKFIQEKLYSTEQMKILISIMLFSGHHVPAVREPNEFSSSKVNSAGGTRFSLLFKRLGKINLKSNTAETCSKLRALFVKNIDNSSFFKNIDRIIITQKYIDEIMGRDDPDHKETYLKNLEKLREEYYLENGSSLVYVTPTKKMYSDANEILLKASNLPYTARRKELYRGMSLDFTLTDEIIEIFKNFYINLPDRAPLVGDEDFYLDAEILITDERVQNYVKDYFKSKTFNFHQLSSWSTDFSIAKSFSGSVESRKISTKQNSVTLPIIFRMITKRGFGIEDFSEFPEEYEVVSGGLFKIKEINFVSKQESQYNQEFYIVINGEQI